MGRPETHAVNAVNAKDRPIVGVDLGGTNMQAGVVGPGGAILAQIGRKTKADLGPDAVFDRLIGAAENVVAEAGLKIGDLAGVGLAVAAAVDAQRGVALEAPNLGWVDFPLAERAADRLGVPVFVENDVNAAVVGEQRFGAIRGEREALGVWVGTGIGGAIILGGSLHPGALGTAGEFGHVTLLPGAPEGVRKLEDTCSRSAIVDRLIRLARTRKTILLDLVNGDAAAIRSGVVARAYEAGDELTRSVVDEAADLIGVAVGSAVTLLGTPVVILGGGLTEALGEPWVRRIAAAAQRHVFPERSRRVRFVMTGLRERAGILGAASLARDRLADPG